MDASEIKLLGILKDNSVKIECRFCNGTGSFPQSSMDGEGYYDYACIICKGLGWNHFQSTDNLFNCKHCYGTGREFDEGYFSGGTCKACCGKGVQEINIKKQTEIDEQTDDSYDNELEHRELEIEKSKATLKSKDAFALLKNLEKENYVTTPEEVKIMDHPSFKRYRSEHIKRLVKDTFNSVFAELEKQTKMTHEKFFAITRPPAKWYKIRFIESFSFHCTNPQGVYFEKCKGKKFKKDSIFRDNGNRRKGFYLISLK